MADRPTNPSGQGTPRAERLPIKLILPKQGKERRVPGGGNPPTPFRTVTSAYRQALSNQVAAIKQGLADPIARGQLTADTPLSPYITPVARVQESTSLADLLPLIRSGQPLLVVVDEHGGTEGLVTVADLAQHSEEDVAAALDVLARGEILLDGQPLEFVNPLVRDAIHADIPAGERALLHERMARRLKSSSSHPGHAGVPSP